MSRHDTDRLADIVDSIATIRSHLTRGDLEDDLIYDAVRARLMDIGEAVKGISQASLAAEPDIPWGDVAGMRDRLAHRYFDASHAIVRATIDNDLPALEAVARRLQETLKE